MQIPATWVIVLVASVLVVGIVPPTGAASVGGNVLLHCQEAIAEQATEFVAGMLAVERRCREAELAAPGSCAAPHPGAVGKLRMTLRAGIASRCDLGAEPLAALGFPGPCDDPEPADGFVVDDLIDCIDGSHTAGVEAIVALLVDRTAVGPVTSDRLACQRAIDRGAIRFATRLLPAVQKCRNRILRGKIVGVAPARCAADDERTIQVIRAREQQFRRTVASRCTPADLLALRVCEPDQATVDGALGCLVGGIRRIVDDPDVSDPPDLIDYEYAVPGVCGDHRRNRAEECDGSDDAGCPGQCGDARGFFACLCQNGPRLRVVQHANADLDLGGEGHDFQVTEGGGYVVDLWDCDQASDFACVVGPSCSLPPHVSCGSSLGAPYTSGSAICASLGLGTCRKTHGGSTGPHCEIDHQQECVSDAQCPTTGDRCVTVPHAPPLPLSRGGVSVCIESRFTEDVTGTVNLETGAGAVRARQRLTFHVGGAIDQPCPVCGGFCAAPRGPTTDPGARARCDHDGDCPGSFCVTTPVCSYGPNADLACRPNPPFGGPTEHFGNPSLDCPPSQNQPLGDLDLLSNPQITALVTSTASRDCLDPDFRDRECIGGVNDQRPCVADTDCPGGSCAGQCFCPGQVRPSSCHAACVGGGNDAVPCGDHSECDPPNGFCHRADCRPDPSDTDSLQEGHCTAGPTNGTCSLSRFQPCASDGNCTHPDCPSCEAGETCVLESAQCFVNGTIQRAGTLGIPERTTAATFCLAGTNSSAVNMIVGMPGPGALTQPESLVVTGF